jgi:hypothetical protein
MTHSSSHLRLSISFLALALATGLPACSADSDEPANAAPTPPSVSGTWRTTCSTQSSGGQESHTVSEVTDRTTPRFTVTVYADRACTTPLFAVGNESDRTVGKLLPGKTDVWELDVKFKRLFVKPLADAALPILTGSGCGSDLAVGVEKDVSSTGCMFFKPIAQCGGDYDIVKVEGDRFWNGVRAGDQCVPSGRPRELNAWPFEKERSAQK